MSPTRFCPHLRFLRPCLLIAVLGSCSSTTEAPAEPAPDTADTAASDASETAALDIADSDPIDTGRVSAPPDSGDVTIDTGMGPAGPPPGSLVDMYGFEACPAEADPWYGDGEKATSLMCNPADWYAETVEGEDWFDVRTVFCAYLTVQQPLRIALHAGDTVEVQIFYSLITAGKAPYVLAVGLGSPGEEVFRHEVDFIPATQQLVTRTFVVPKDVAAGEPVYFHVSNHGTNVWALTRLAVVTPR